MKKESLVKAVEMWLCMAIFFFYCFIARSSFVTVLANDFMKFYAIDAAGLSALTSCYYWVYTGMQIPVGIICDKFSLRKTATIMCMTTAIGLLALVISHHFYLAALGEMIIGFGSSFAFILCLKVITARFPEHKITIMSAYTTSLGAFGPVVGGPAVSMITKHFAWRDVIMVYAGLGVLLAVVIWSIVRDSSKKDGAKEEEHAPILDSLKQITQSGQLWLIALFTMALYAPLSSLGDLWGVLFVKTVFNADQVTATFACNMLYIGMVIGSPIMAALAQAIDSYKKVMLMAICGEVICLGLSIAIPGLPVAAAFVLLFITGLCTGAQLSFPLAFTLFPKKISATISGFVNMTCMVSGIVLMPLFGWVLNKSWNGTMAEGIKVYSAADFKWGVVSVIVFISVGVILTFFIKDRSPNAARE